MQIKTACSLIRKYMGMNKKAGWFTDLLTRWGSSAMSSMQTPGMLSANGSVRPSAGSMQMSEGNSSQGSGNVAAGLPLSAAGTAALPVGTVGESALGSGASSASSAGALDQYGEGIDRGMEALDNIGIGPTQLEQIMKYIETKANKQ